MSLKSRNQIAAIVVILVLLGVAVKFYFFRTDDASIVRNRVKEAAEVMSEEPGGSGISLQNIGAAHALGDFFTENAELGASRSYAHEGYDLTANSRAQIISLYFLLRPQASSLKIELSEIEVKFPDESHKTAQIKCTAVITGTTRDGSAFREVRQLTAELIMENDNTWRILKAHADFVIGIA